MVESVDPGQRAKLDGLGASPRSAPMDLLFWPGAVVMMLVATLTASLTTSGGHSTWFVGVLLLMVDLIFAMTLHLLPPAGP